MKGTETPAVLVISVASLLRRMMTGVTATTMTEKMMMMMRLLWQQGNELEPMALVSGNSGRRMIRIIS